MTAPSVTEPTKPALERAQTQQESPKLEPVEPETKVIATTLQQPEPQAQPETKDNQTAKLNARAKDASFFGLDVEQESTPKGSTSQEVNEEKPNTANPAKPPQTEVLESEVESDTLEITGAEFVQEELPADFWGSDASSTIVLDPISNSESQSFDDLAQDAPTEQVSPNEEATKVIQKKSEKAEAIAQPVPSPSASQKPTESTSTSQEASATESINDSNEAATLAKLQSLFPGRLELIEDTIEIDPLEVEAPSVEELFEDV